MLAISAAQIDRVLGARKAGQDRVNRRTPKANAAVKALVPVRRQLLGFGRLGHNLLMPPVFELLEAWSVWRNCFTTTFKQIEKRREASKTIRKHEKTPRPPCARLMEHCARVGDKETAEALQTWQGRHDPFELKDWIEKRLEMIWALDAALNAAENDGETDLEGVAAPILRGHRRSAPLVAQNQKHDPRLWPKNPAESPTHQDATNSPKTA